MKMPAAVRFLVTFLIITHLPRQCFNVYACISPPRRTRVASAWHPRCAHRNRCFRLFREKRSPDRSQSDFNPLSKRDARKQEVEEETGVQAMERENEGCDGSATRSPPSRASSTCCWRATRPPRRSGRTYPAMNRGQLREGENAAP